MSSGSCWSVTPASTSCRFGRSVWEHYRPSHESGVSALVRLPQLRAGIPPYPGCIRVSVQDRPAGIERATRLLDSVDGVPRLEGRDADRPPACDPIRGDGNRDRRAGERIGLRRNDCHVATGLLPRFRVKLGPRNGGVVRLLPCQSPPGRKRGCWIRWVLRLPGTPGPSSVPWYSPLRTSP